ncbi:DUF305 domain-containing protein [Actinoplanes sp. KI2]|uniref:DUF305 domain-containing protein n=1 Tax=Actinoplanes sp. KI2 TaxID=2983315 RepID=UPI0021D573C3|nr:DUF305 domain-containing protein [Actinoplanes sp. KI2]MCU7729335.1 DUF305 domain-containing protein [Actinoplanes sp. KI2]
MAVRRYLAVALVLVATTAAVVALGRGHHAAPKPRSAAQAQTAVPDAADADYAQMMIAHHAQAVRMSKDLLGRPGVPDRIADIARFIVADQEREIDQLTAWLTAWHLDPDSAAGHGMLAPADLTRLAKAPTAEAVPLYLRLMIKHHQGAIDMSRGLLNGGGQNVFIHRVAKHVINEQTAENSAMTALLTGSDSA